MKVSIEYVVIGREKKYPDVAGEVFVPDEWTEEQIKKWFEERHHNLGGKRVKVINIETKEYLYEFK